MSAAKEAINGSAPGASVGRLVGFVHFLKFLIVAKYM